MPLNSPHSFPAPAALVRKIQQIGKYNSLNKIPLTLLPSLVLSGLSVYFSLQYESRYPSYSFVDEKIKELDTLLMQGWFCMATAALSLPIWGFSYLMGKRWNDLKGISGFDYLIAYLIQENYLLPPEAVRENPTKFNKNFESFRCFLYQLIDHLLEEKNKWTTSTAENYLKTITKIIVLVDEYAQQVINFLPVPNLIDLTPHDPLLASSTAEEVDAMTVNLRALQMQLETYNTVGSVSTQAVNTIALVGSQTRNLLTNKIIPNLDDHQRRIQRLEESTQNRNILTLEEVSSLSISLLHYFIEKTQGVFHPGEKVYICGISPKEKAAATLPLFNSNHLLIEFFSYGWTTNAAILENAQANEILRKNIETIKKLPLKHQLDLYNLLYDRSERRERILSKLFPKGRPANSNRFFISNSESQQNLMEASIESQPLPTPNS